MKPRLVISFLRSIAADIDKAEQPSRSFIASRLFGLTAAVESGGAINADFAAKFDRTFRLLDTQSEMNLVLIYDIKRAMPEFASEFDNQVLAMRDAGLYELEPYDRMAHGGVPPSYLRAGIKTPDGNLIWVSKSGVSQPEPPPPEFDLEDTWEEFAIK